MCKDFYWDTGLGWMFIAGVCSCQWRAFFITHLRFVLCFSLGSGDCFWRRSIESIGNHSFCEWFYYSLVHFQINIWKRSPTFTTHFNDIHKQFIEILMRKKGCSQEVALNEWNTSPIISSDNALVSWKKIEILETEQFIV